MVTCPECGQQNPDGFRFCGACGSAFATAVGAATREERKRISVLFCDLVGFTGRAEAMDPEEVRALLQPYHARVREELERYGGTVEKFIGDAVVALFGAPTAHEDDPERAVRAGLAIRDAVAGDDLHIRIGITTGEALVALDARPESGEGMASGDVVNTAARLQAAAPVDGILVDEATYRATQRAIDYRDHPPIEAKGKAAPVAVHEALVARSRLGLDVGERSATPFVGRRLELDVLGTAFRRASRERIPQLLTLVGVPGMGKSRLVMELFRLTDEDPDLVRWRQGRCLPYGAGVTLWALAEIVKAQAGILETDTADEAQAKLGEAVGQAVGAGERAWVERHLRPLVGLESDGELTGERRDEAFAAWRRFFEGVADQAPLVLVIEDLQWADDALLDFLEHLVDWASDVRLLIVATARPELLARRPGWGGGTANAVNLSLAPLTDEETAALAGAVLGRGLMPVEVRDTLLANAGGNPLYAEEFARLYAERGPSQAETAVPDSVQGMIAARIDSLERSEKALIQDAAVLGKVFWLGAVEAMTGEDKGALERRLHELERREFVRRDRQSAVAGERQYAFRHLLIREVAYGQIPRARRAERHAAVARWIEALAPDRSDDRADMLAHHWTAALEYAMAAGRAGEELADRARRSLIDAGDRALALNAATAAADFFDRALAIAPDAAVTLRLGRSLYLAGDERAGTVLGEARDALAARGDAEGEAFAEAMLSHLDWLAGDTEEATRRVERAVELARPLPASPVKAHVFARAASRANVAARLADALALGREALVLAEELGLADLRVHALTTVGDARAFLGDRGGWRDLEAALELGRAIDSPEAGRAAHNLGVRHFLDGDIARFGELLAEGLRIDERLGSVGLARFARGTWPAIEYFVGDWDDAERHATDFLAHSEAAPHYQDAHVHAVRAAIRFARDDVAGALADIELALGGARDPQAQAAPLGFGGWIFWELGDPRAERTAIEALELRFGSAPEPVSVTLLSPLEVPAPIERALRAAIGEPRTDESRWVTAARAALERRFLDAAEIYRSMPYRHAEAYARFRAAEQLLSEGRRSEADAQLRQALDFWRSVRATRFVRLGETLLPATA